MAAGSAERWIEVVNWARFQHHQDGRTLPWIKAYTADLHDHNYLDLSGHRRAVLAGLRLVYSSSHARLRLDARSLSRRLSLRVTSADLEALNDAGFIRFLSRPALVQRREEKRREEERKARTTEKERKEPFLSPPPSEKSAGGSALVEQVMATLAEIPKPGYSEAKLTAVRLGPLLGRFDGLDVVYEAEKLRDWELYGGGSAKTTKDGVARFRFWLDKALALHAQHPAEQVEQAPPWLKPGQIL